MEVENKKQKLKERIQELYQQLLKGDINETHVKKSPTFQLYVQDFLVGTMHMKTEQIGAYFLLLLYQWDKFGLPNDPDRVCIIGKCSGDDWDNIMDKFILTKDGKLKNKRLEMIRAEQLANRESKSRSGKLGNDARWGNKETPETTGKGSVQKDDLTGLPNWFRIGMVIYKLAISEFIRENMPEFLNVWKMQNKDIPTETVLAEMDKTCCGKTFNDDNHIHNTFKSTAKDLKPKKAYNRSAQETSTKTSSPKPFVSK